MTNKQWQPIRSFTETNNFIQVIIKLTELNKDDASINYSRIISFTEQKFL